MSPTPSPAPGRARIVMPNGWTASLVVNDLTRTVSLAAWPTDDPVEQRSRDRRWFHPAGDVPVADGPALLAELTKIRAAPAPVPLVG